MVTSFPEYTGGRIRDRPQIRTDPDFGRDLSRQNPNTKKGAKNGWLGKHPHNPSSPPCAGPDDDGSAKSPTHATLCRTRFASLSPRASDADAERRTEPTQEYRGTLCPPMGETSSGSEPMGHPEVRQSGADGKSGKHPFCRKVVTWTNQRRVLDVVSDRSDTPGQTPKYKHGCGESRTTSKNVLRLSVEEAEFDRYVSFVAEEEAVLGCGDSDKSDLLWEWWRGKRRELPTLRKLFFCLCVVSSNSAFSERVFS
eukprot:scaffold2560_cov226-Pinguiococcus_pyrenoidosus.AAC.2